jgi:dihydrofolate reductase
VRKLILKMSMSLDGFVGGPDGQINWIFPTMDDAAGKWTIDQIWKAGVHIMGRRTFHDMASWWPYSKEPFAPPMNEIPKVVFSKKGVLGPTTSAMTTKAVEDALQAREARGESVATASPAVLASWTGARVASGDLKEEIIRLKQEPGKDIIAHGGAGFARNLVATGLIDEYLLMVHPVALGRGMALFAGLAEPVDLKLVEVIAFSAGAVAHVYRPAAERVD